MARLLYPVLLLASLAACGGGGGGDSDENVASVPTPSPDTVVTDCGSFQGNKEFGVTAFRGIPYAKSPLGPLRWQPPASADCAATVRPALVFQPACAQFDRDGSILSDTEDCLYLNIWTPAGEFPSNLSKPVLFFIHGGGNQRGSPDTEVLGATLYDGAQLAARSDTIVVTVAYRLGALGFLAHPALSAENAEQRSGNYGLLDQLAALEWVQRNIAGFGGDPQRVTIFGESGGSRDVCALVASPLGSGLFAGAIMQSGGCRQKTLASAEVDGQAIAIAAGCESAFDAGCLRSASVQSLLDAIGPELSEGAFVGENIGPVVDGHVLLQSPDQAIAEGTHNMVPLIIGSNTDETGNFAVADIDELQYRSLVYAQFGTLFGDRVLAQYPSSDYASPTAAYIALSTDSQFICPARVVTRSAARHSQPVYAYRFAKSFDSAPLQRLGAFHGIELFYIFQKLADVENYTATDSDKSVESTMAGYWSSFARNGNPNIAGQAEWEPYAAAADTVLQIDVTSIQTAEPRTSECDFWDNLRQGINIDFARDNGARVGVVQAQGD